MTDTNQLREAFEARMTDDGKWPAAVEKGRGGAYLLAQTENAWTEWEACAEALQARAQVQGEPDDGLCYVQDSRSYVGNCPLWWRPEGKGYTTNLDDAGRYTFDEAMRMHESRSTDIPWLCREIDPIRRATVDAQYLPRDTSDQGAAMLTAAQAQKGRP